MRSPSKEVVVQSMERVDGYNNTIDYNDLESVSTAGGKDPSDCCFDGARASNNLMNLRVSDDDRLKMVMRCIMQKMGCPGIMGDLESHFPQE